jgi:MFS family permease
MVAAGPLWEWLGRGAFFLNAAIYAGSWAIFRFGVREAAVPAHQGRQGPGALSRYRALLSTSHIWLLAPTWIAVNAAIGLWTTQSLFQLVRRADPVLASRQLLMGGFTPLQVSVGLAIGLLIFFAGLLYWGSRFRALRRTTIIFYGIVGGALAIGCAFVVNHSSGQPILVPALFTVGAGVGLFVLAGATPAALGLLADISEGHPRDRGAIMGLYSVFLAIGQVAGSLIGGEAARMAGIDGILAATILLLAVAVVPLSRLRAYEHVVDGIAREGRAVDRGAHGRPVA